LRVWRRAARYGSRQQYDNSWRTIELLVCLDNAGKSYLMNLLAGTTGMFQISNSDAPCTQGVDLATHFLTLPQYAAGTNGAVSASADDASSMNDGEDQVPVVRVGFVDVEGQGDRDVGYDTMLVSPVLLAAKVVIFNWRGGVEKDSMLQKLGCLAWAARNIDHGRDDDDDDDDSDSNDGLNTSLEDVAGGFSRGRHVFGHLHIVIRDWQYEGTESTVKKRLFRSENGTAPEISTRNEIRRLIRENFESIKIWLFPSPVQDTTNLTGNIIETEQLTANFKQVLAEFRAHTAVQLAQPKLFNRQPLTAEIVGQMMPVLADALNDPANEALRPQPLFEAVQRRRSDNAVTQAHAELEALGVVLGTSAEEVPCSNSALSLRFTTASANVLESFDATVAGNGLPPSLCASAKDQVQARREAQETMLLEANTRRLINIATAACLKAQASAEHELQEAFAAPGSLPTTAEQIEHVRSKAEDSARLQVESALKQVDACELKVVIEARQRLVEALHTRAARITEHSVAAERARELSEDRLFQQERVHSHTGIQRRSRELLLIAVGGEFGAHQIGPGIDKSSFEKELQVLQSERAQHLDTVLEALGSIRCRRDALRHDFLESTISAIDAEMERYIEVCGTVAMAAEFSASSLLERSIFEKLEKLEGEVEVAEGEMKAGGQSESDTQLVRSVCEKCFENAVKQFMGCIGTWSFPAAIRKVHEDRLHARSTELGEHQISRLRAARALAARTAARLQDQKAQLQKDSAAEQTLLKADADLEQQRLKTELLYKLEQEQENSARKLSSMQNEKDTQESATRHAEASVQDLKTEQAAAVQAHEKALEQADEICRDQIVEQETRLTEMSRVALEECSTAIREQFKTRLDDADVKAAEQLEAAKQQSSDLRAEAMASQAAEAERIALLVREHEAASGITRKQLDRSEVSGRQVRLARNTALLLVSGMVIVVVMLMSGSLPTLADFAGRFGPGTQLLSSRIERLQLSHDNTASVLHECQQSFAAADATNTQKLEDLHVELELATAASQEASSLTTSGSVDSTDSCPPCENIEDTANSSRTQSAMAFRLEKAEAELSVVLSEAEAVATATADAARQQMLSAIENQQQCESDLAALTARANKSGLSKTSTEDVCDCEGAGVDSHKVLTHDSTTTWNCAEELKAARGDADRAELAAVVEKNRTAHEREKTRTVRNKWQSWLDACTAQVDALKHRGDSSAQVGNGKEQMPLVHSGHTNTRQEIEDATAAVFSMCINLPMRSEPETNSGSALPSTDTERATTSALRVLVLGSESSAGKSRVHQTTAAGALDIAIVNCRQQNLPMCSEEYLQGMPLQTKVWAAFIQHQLYIVQYARQELKNHLTERRYLAHQRGELWAPLVWFRLGGDAPDYDTAMHSSHSWLNAYEHGRGGDGGKWLVLTHNLVDDPSSSKQLAFYFPEQSISGFRISCTDLWQIVATDADATLLAEVMWRWLRPGGILSVVTSRSDEDASMPPLQMLSVQLQAQGFILRHTSVAEHDRSQSQPVQVLMAFKSETNATQIEGENNPTVLSVPAFTINLPARTARWHRFSARAAEAGLVENEDFVNFRASDGTMLLDASAANATSYGSRAQMLFSLQKNAVGTESNLNGWRYGESARNPHLDHGFRQGVLGCAMSHYRLWSRLSGEREQDYCYVNDGIGHQPIDGEEAECAAERNSNIKVPELHDEEDIALVFEDDVVLSDGFVARWQRLLPVLQRDQLWDVVFLGTHDEIRSAVYADQTVPGTTSVGPVRHINSTPRTFGGGTFAYAIRKRAARALVRRANTEGISQGSDWFMLEAISSPKSTQPGITGESNIGENQDFGVTAYRCDPPLATSAHALQLNNKRDFAAANTASAPSTIALSGGANVESDVHDLYPAGRLLLGSAERDFNPSPDKHQTSHFEVGIIRLLLTAPLNGSHSEPNVTVNCNIIVQVRQTPSLEHLSRL
jgi:GR25 family glycosyltransferase involved in LPS biosynthesis